MIKKFVALGIVVSLLYMIGFKSEEVKADACDITVVASENPQPCSN